MATQAEVVDSVPSNAVPVNQSGGMTQFVSFMRHPAVWFVLGALSVIIYSEMMYHRGKRTVKKSALGSLFGAKDET